MDIENTTMTSEFILLGFYELPDHQFTLFVIFLLLYLMAMISNLFIIVVIYFSPNLHKPMYYFLCNLAIVDMILTTTAMPKFLNICLTGNHFISLTGCFTQGFFFVLCIISEPSILLFMAYDRFVAICYPLRYNYFMSSNICVILALTSWGCGIPVSLQSTVLISRFKFFKDNKIDRLFCDLDTELKLAIGSIQQIQATIFVCAFLFVCVPMVLIIMSYVSIFYNILKIRSSEGKRKAFSTCSSHLMVITIFVTMLICVFISPKPKYTIDVDKVLALLHTSCIPTLNPLIYSLKNKDVHVAIQKLMTSIHVGIPI